jgi:hypothetical protein
LRKIPKINVSNLGAEKQLWGICRWAGHYAEGPTQATGTRDFNSTESCLLKGNLIAVMREIMTQLKGFRTACLLQRYYSSGKQRTSCDDGLPLKEAH